MKSYIFISNAVKKCCCRSQGCMATKRIFHRWSKEAKTKFIGLFKSFPIFTFVWDNKGRFRMIHFSGNELFGLIRNVFFKKTYRGWISSYNEASFKCHLKSGNCTKELKARLTKCHSRKSVHDINRKNIFSHIRDKIESNLISLIFNEQSSNICELLRKSKLVLAGLIT